MLGITTPKIRDKTEKLKDFYINNSILKCWFYVPWNLWDLTEL